MKMSATTADAAAWFLLSWAYTALATVQNKNSTVMLVYEMRYCVLRRSTLVMKAPVTPVIKFQQERPRLMMFWSRLLVMPTVARTFAR